VPSKRGGKRPGAGRGRGGHHAPIPSDHDSRPSPRDTHDTEMGEAGSLHHPVTTNGTGKRGGRKGHQHHSHDINQNTTDSDKDIPLTVNGIGSTGTDTDPNNGRPPTSDPSNNHTPSHQGAKREGKEPSMLELKRRAIAMLDYIERAQVEMARQSVTPSGKEGASPGVSPSTVISAAEAKPEEGLSAKEILEAESIKERIVGWQAEYGGSSAQQ
jgi:hypothetical protein